MTEDATTRRDSVPSPRTMGLEQLQTEVVTRRSAAGLSQKRAAAAWDVPVATIAVVEKGIDRNYRPTTIGRFDKPFGWKPGTAWKVLHGAEPEPPATTTEVHALALRVDELAAVVADLVAAPLPSNAQARLLSVLAELDDDEVAQLTATAEWLAARRRRTGT